MFGQPKLKVSRLFVTLTVAFLALGLSFLNLSLSLGSVQAAPSDQGGVFELVLPAVNAGNQTSVYTVTHLGGTVPISTFHSFYAGGFPNGQVVAIYSDAHNPFETKVYSLNRFPNFPPDFVGDVVITSTQPITGSVINIQPIIAVTSNQPIAGSADTNPILPPLSPPSLLLPERVEINWTVVTYIIVGLFALSGFFKGWWKEAITTFFIGILIFFLAVPSVAEWFIDTINRIIIFIWDILVGAELVTGQAIQLDGSSGGTWLVILLLFIGLAIFISRASLPNVIRGGASYIVTPLGGILGGLLGGLNGFLILNLARQYLEGSNLPGSDQPATEITMTGTGPVAIASSGVDFRVIDLPNFTIFNALLPWVMIVFVILVFLLTWKYRKIPWGYVKYTIGQEREMTVLAPVVVQR